MKCCNLRNICAFFFSLDQCVFLFFFILFCTLNMEDFMELEVLVSLILAFLSFSIPFSEIIRAH